jgi:hypothetical protein
MNNANLELLVAAFVRDHLSPRQDERDMISQRYEQLQGFLGDRTFQNGSYARHTSTTPVNDLDVIYLLPEDIAKTVHLAERVDPYRLDIHRVIETLAEQLRECYGSSATIKAQPHSVGIYFGREDEFSMDVVPALDAPNNMVWVPEIAHHSVAARRAIYKASSAPPGPNWIKSDPRGYIDQATRIDEETDGNLRKAAKALKSWRWRCRVDNANFAVKSFHLEMAVTRQFNNNPDLTISECIEEIIAELPMLLREPQFPDRADNRRFIDDYVDALTAQERAVILSAVSRAASLWEGVKIASSEQDVHTRLQTLFGQTGSAKTQVARLPKGMTPDNGRDLGEEFLSDQGIPIHLEHEVKINARVNQDGFRPFLLRGSRSPLKRKRDLAFSIEECTVPEPFDVKWKVKNTGAEAARLGQLRGHILNDAGNRERTESTRYWGNHYVQCYIIKNGVCVAVDHLEVPIGNV